MRGQKLFVWTNCDSGSAAQIDFLERDGPHVVRDEHRVATDSLKPRDHILRIFHTAAEEQELRFRRREGERQFVMHAPHRVGDHLIFVDHEKARTVPAQEAGTLCFQGRDHDPGIEIQGQIAGRNADVPATRAPFRELVVRQRSRGHGEDRLPFEGRVEQLKNEGLARAGRRLDDHVLPIAERVDGLLLPEIRDDEIYFESRWHRGK